MQTIVAVDHPVDHIAVRAYVPGLSFFLENSARLCFSPFFSSFTPWWPQPLLALS
ncbi:MAG: hypothetical protein K2W86_13020 [Sphingomonas sp.]|nr:hypothetical protein [Sphingomonas sp.]